jgi:hypothetical protein
MRLASHITHRHPYMIHLLNNTPLEHLTLAPFISIKKNKKYHC